MAAYGNLITLIAIGLFSIMFGTAISSPSTGLILQICNGDHFPNNDPFAYSLAYVLSDLETVTPNRPNFDYYTNSPYPESVAYGHASCIPGASYPDCVTCISYIKRQLVEACSSTIGAQMVVQDCRMRYEQYPFTE